jgi:hypothetical protein
MKNENFITIQGWMRNELGLKGNELILYAIIYGFSQDGVTEFRGSVRYVMEWLGLSNRGVLNLLHGLLEKNLIEKRETTSGYFYKVVKKVHRIGEESSPPSGEESSPNKYNINNNNKNDTENFSYEKSSTSYKTKQKIYKQRGLEYKPKKSRFIEVGKVVEEFRAAASARGFNLLKSDGQRNKRIRGQIEALLIAGKDLKGLINWWFKGEGDYCGYAPENLFTERTVETYHVKNKKKEVKDTTPNFQKLKEKWKSQNKNQRKRS